MMRRHKPEQGKLATHFPNHSAGWSLDPEVHMFAEDIYLGVMPIGGRIQRDKFRIRFEGQAEQADIAVRLLAQLAEYRNGDADEITCSAVELIARDLAYNGRAIYEVAQEEGDAVLLFIPSEGIYRVGPWWVQVIPKEDRAYWKQSFVCVRERELWAIEMPAALGGFRGHARTLDRLREVEHLGPPFFRADLEKGMRDSNFDFATYRRHAENHIRRLTRVWGWNSRDWGLDRQTEFFAFDRMMKFRWAQAVLRQHIIDEINRMLLRRRVQSRLIVEGLPGPGEIWDAHTAMMRGSMPFSALNAVVAV